MPTYDVKCPEGCGYFNDVFSLLADLDKMVCPECHAPVVRLISPVRTIGPTFSKPFQVDQIGKSFESKSDWDKYQQDNPDVQILSANSQSWRNHVDSVKDRIEKKAKRQGFRDNEDRKRHLKSNQSSSK
jgi:hypothetical protein